MVNFVTNSGLGEICAITTIIMLGMGTVLDGISIFLIFVSLLMPIMRFYEWSPVRFGLNLSYMVAIGQFTPPLAMNLMITSKFAGIEQTTRWVLWFVAAMLIALISFPEMSIRLPRVRGAIEEEGRDRI